MDHLNELLKKRGYVLSKFISSGAQGSVYTGRDSEGQFIAIKVSKIKLRSREKYYDLDIGSGNSLFEARFGILAEHPNILKMMDYFVDEDFTFLVMERADRDLFTELRVNTLSLSEKKQYIFEIAHAINYMHKNGFLHGDVKPPNVLIKKQKAILGDFGLISLMEDMDPEKAFQTFNYRAPENISKKEACLEIYRRMYRNTSLDYRLSEVWSLGVLCLDIVYNIPSITMKERISGCKFVSKNHKDAIPYENFLNTLSKLKNMHLYPELKGYTTFKLVKLMLGEVPADCQNLLRLICDNLLLLNPKQRSIRRFIESSEFSSMVAPELTAFEFPVVEKMYTETEVVDKSSLKILIDWLMDVSSYKKLYPIIVMNTIDYVIQRMHLKKFVSELGDLQLFASSVLWLMMRLYSYDYYMTLSDMKSLCCGGYTAKEFVIMIVKILDHERGAFRYESLYFHMPTEELMKKALDVMIEPEEYLKYANPRELAKELMM